MRSKLLFLTVSLLMANLFVLNAQVNYTVPDGGWTYIYNGDAVETVDSAALDGTWSHNNGSDEWDLTEIGAGNPGGAMVIEDGDDTYLRIQDTGDPRKLATSPADDPSNRKICFTHQFVTDGVTDSMLLDNGITLAFRVRIPTTGEIDDISDPADNTQSITYPDDGDGQMVSNYGKGMITVAQGTAIKEQIAFSLYTFFDDATALTGVEGLVMNSLIGNEPIQGHDVNFPSTNLDAIYNELYVDPIEWHEFWIQIIEDDSEEGTHSVKVWVDGEEDPTEFIVTCGIAGSGDGANSYITLGSLSTGESSAEDIDYLAYKEGIVDPVLPSTRINNQATDFYISLYPNPFNNSLRISAHEVFNRITVTNMMGAELTKMKVYDRDVIVNLENLNSGIYILQLEGEFGNVSHKIIKK